MDLSCVSLSFHRNIGAAFWTKHWIINANSLDVLDVFGKFEVSLLILQFYQKSILNTKTQKDSKVHHNPSWSSSSWCTRSCIPGSGRWSLNAHPPGWRHRHQLSWFHFLEWQMAETCLTSPYGHPLSHCCCIAQRHMLCKDVLCPTPPFGYTLLWEGKKIYQHQHFRLNRRWVWRRSDWITRAAPSFSHQTPIHICHPEWFAHPPNIFTEYNKNKTILSNEKATWSVCGGKNFVKCVSTIVFLIVAS